MTIGAAFAKVALEDDLGVCEATAGCRSIVRVLDDLGAGVSVTPEFRMKTGTYEELVATSGIVMSPSYEIYSYLCPGSCDETVSIRTTLADPGGEVGYVGYEGCQTVTRDGGACVTWPLSVDGVTSD